MSKTHLSYPQKTKRKSIENLISEIRSSKDDKKVLREFKIFLRALFEGDPKEELLRRIKVPPKQAAEIIQIPYPQLKFWMSRGIFGSISAKKGKRKGLLDFDSLTKAMRIRNLISIGLSLKQAEILLRYSFQYLMIISSSLHERFRNMTCTVGWRRKEALSEYYATLWKKAVAEIEHLSAGEPLLVQDLSNEKRFVFRFSEQGSYSRFVRALGSVYEAMGNNEDISIELDVKKQREELRKWKI